MANVRAKALVPLVEESQRPGRGDCFWINPERLLLLKNLKMAIECPHEDQACLKKQQDENPRTITMSLRRQMELAKEKEQEERETSRKLAEFDGDPNKLWTKKISAAEYLKSYPTGPQAGLAKEIVDYNDTKMAADVDDTNKTED